MKPPPFDPSQARTSSLKRLARKVTRGQFARPLAPGASISDFLAALPDVLAASQFRQLACAIADAHRGSRTFLLMMGAHPLKVGLGPLIHELIRDGVISAVATNGAAIIHDFELAMIGRTSEDVAAQLLDGSFGMAEETGAFLNRASKDAARDSIGLGEAVGRAIIEARLKFREASIFATAREAGIPATVHVTLGADIIHMHPSADGAAIGQSTFTDFHRLASVVAGLSRGVVLNLGSAVVMPEVFLKALNLARNLGHQVDHFTAADMDFVRQYRPRMNVVERPTIGGGQGISLTGHHELMFPLLVAAIREELAQTPVRVRRRKSNR
jgi:deoxyhypusine synthase